RDPERGTTRETTRETDWRQERNFRYTYGVRRDPHYQTNTQRTNSSQARPSAKARLSFSRESVAATPQGGLKPRNSNGLQRNEWRPVSQTGPNSKSINSHVSHTPSPRPQREGKSLQLSGTPRGNQNSNEGSGHSRSKGSTLNRLSLPTERIPLLQDGVANAESGRLQEVDIPYLEETIPELALQSGEKSLPSSSRNPPLVNLEQYDPSQDRSPIRTLSEDRLHVSLRLAPLRDEEIDEEIEEKSLGPRESTVMKRLASTITRTDKGKGVVPPQVKKRVCQSPAQGVSLKRRRITKSQNTPRKKLLQDAISSKSTYRPPHRTNTRPMSERTPTPKWLRLELGADPLASSYKTWKLAPTSLTPNTQSCDSMEALLKACHQMTALPPTGLTMPLHPWIMWVLWTSRNQFSFEDKSFSESEMILKAIKLAKEWQSAQPLPASSSVSSKDYQLSNKDQSPLQ
ncbi:hypothetical protein HID58_082468, partial [Brassica napus]